VLGGVSFSRIRYDNWAAATVALARHTTAPRLTVSVPRGMEMVIERSLRVNGSLPSPAYTGPGMTQSLNRSSGLTRYEPGGNPGNSPGIK
jgi:hypothetical protein